MGNQKIKLNTTLFILMIFTIFGLSLGSFIYTLNTSFPEIKNVVQPLERAQAQTTSLFITNIRVSSLTSNTVTISWDTNLLADSRLNIGRTADYEMTGTCTTCSDTTNFVRTHRITVGGLEPGTIYHYQVISSTDAGETKTSLDRTFTTPSASDDDKAPYVTYIRVDSTNTQAEMAINTSEDSLVTVYYDTASRNTADLYNYEIGESLSDQWADGDEPVETWSIDHSLTLTDGIAASTVYYYRILTVDASNNSTLSGEFTFTSSSDTDHVFSTGQCEGGVPLGGCTADGLYCDVGTATLINNCGQCGYTCPAGQTCQEGGVCTDDPSLTGDPYQCNPSSCYEDGFLIVPAEPGCYSSYPKCDANIILKVKKDRECAKWLTCGTGVQSTDPVTGQKEELCLDLVVCTSLGESGQCNSYVDLPQEEQTFRTPDEIEKIQWLTGAINAGLDWQYEVNSPVIKGYYPWSAMEEVGEKIIIDNYNFEETVSADHDDDSDTPNILTYDIRFFGNFIKYPNNPENTTAISNVWDPESRNQKTNRVLKVEQMSAAGQGVRIKVNGNTSTTSKYIASLRIKSSDYSEQKVIIRLNNGLYDAGSVNDFGTYELNSGWQKIMTPPIDGVGGSETYLEIILAPDSNIQAFYIDDVKIEPVLKANEDLYLKRSCRLYPKEDSLYCEYYDNNGIYNKGWYGYCLQRDPANESKCISWWPVDVIYGEGNLFGLEEEAGYTNREPLYYCLESAASLDLTPEVVCRDLPHNPDDGSYCTYDNSNEECSEDCLSLYEYPDGFCYGTDHMAIKYFKYADGYPPQCGHLVYDGTSTPDRDFSDYINKDNLIKAVVSVRFRDEGIGSTFATDYELNESNNWSLWLARSNYATCNTELKNTLLNQDWYDENSIANQCGSVSTYDNDCCDAEGWGSGIQLKFDENGNFNETMLVIGHHTSNDGQLYVSDIKFHFKELCTEIVKVVEEGGGNAAWADTVNSSGYIVPDLEYQINTDLNPFGGAVTASGLPTNWGKILSVEEPINWLDSLDSPYQERAGKPYACVEDCENRICWGGNFDGSSCITNKDCINNEATTPEQGVCIGVGSAAASDRGDQTATKWPNTADDQYFAEFRIRGLFAQTYGVYRWEPSVGGYAQVNSSTDSLLTDRYGWGPPNRLCEGSVRLNRYDPADTSTYCGIAPKVRNIRLGDGTSNTVYLGSDGGSVELSFNTMADSQQQPLKAIYINWGDNKSNYILYPYRSKGDPDNPHVYPHAYTAGSCDATGGICKIKILVEDNWGWISAWPNEGLQYYGTCEGGSENGEPCTNDIYCPIGVCTTTCIFGGGTCNMNEPYNYLNIDLRYLDPVDIDACRGGICSDGVCEGGIDDGRPCGNLVVDLND